MERKGRGRCWMQNQTSPRPLEESLQHRKGSIVKPLLYSSFRLAFAQPTILFAAPSSLSKESLSSCHKLNWTAASCFYKHWSFYTPSTIRHPTCFTQLPVQANDVGKTLRFLFVTVALGRRLLVQSDKCLRTCVTPISKCWEIFLSRLDSVFLFHSTSKNFIKTGFEGSFSHSSNKRKFKNDERFWFCRLTSPQKTSITSNHYEYIRKSLQSRDTT